MELKRVPVDGSSHRHASPITWGQGRQEIPPERDAVTWSTKPGVCGGMSADDFTPRDVLIEAAIAKVEHHLHITDRTDLEARELRPGRFMFATAGSLSYVARAANLAGADAGPERAEVMAYQDGVRLGREAPAEGTKARGMFPGQAG